LKEAGRREKTTGEPGGTNLLTTDTGSTRTKGLPSERRLGTTPREREATLLTGTAVEVDTFIEVL
jgi:hypothetical protein